MNEEYVITSARTFLASLNAANGKGERAEDLEVLVDFTDTALRTLPEREAYSVVKRIVDLLIEQKFRPNNEAIFRTRDMADEWRKELVANLRRLVQFDSLAADYKYSVGHYYMNDSSIYRELRVAIQMLSAYSMSISEIEDLVRKKLAGKGETHEVRLNWVMQLLAEDSVQFDVSGMIGIAPHHDRPKGGGARKEHDIALAYACRLLNEALPNFAKKQWALHAHLLTWAGFEKVSGKLVERAVIGNRRRL